MNTRTLVEVDLQTNGMSKKIYSVGLYLPYPCYANKPFASIRDNPFPLKQHFTSTELQHNFLPIEACLINSCNRYHRKQENWIHTHVPKYLSHATCQILLTSNVNAKQKAEQKHRKNQKKNNNKCGQNDEQIKCITIQYIQVHRDKIACLCLLNVLDSL